MNTRERGMPEGVFSGEISVPKPKAPPDTNKLPNVIVDQDDKQRRISQEIINGMQSINEIYDNIKSPEAELGVNLKGSNHPDDWLVFVEDEVGQLGGNAAGIIDKIKEIAEARKTKNEEGLKENNKINLNEFIKMLEKVKGDSTVAKEIIERLKGLMNEKKIDLSESEAEVSEVSKHLKGIHPVASWVAYFDKRIVEINDDIKKAIIIDSNSSVNQKEFNNILINKLLPNLKLTATIMTGLDTLTEMTKNQ